MNISQLGPLVAGHQPNFFPWFGYFEKMLKADIFVHSDDVQYPKRSYTNRVEIPIAGVESFLTLPVRKGSEKNIAEKQYLKHPTVLKKISKTVSINLGHLPFYADLEPVMQEFQHVFNLFSTVGDLNIHMNHFLSQSMGIQTSTMRGSELGLGCYRSNERLIERCRRLQSRQYLCGKGADDYQDEALLNSSGILLRRIEYGIGEAIFGADLKFSILHGIAKVGLNDIRAAVNDYINANRFS